MRAVGGRTERARARARQREAETERERERERDMNRKATRFCRPSTRHPSIERPELVCHSKLCARLPPNLIYSGRATEFRQREAFRSHLKDGLRHVRTHTQPHKHGCGAARRLRAP